MRIPNRNTLDLNMKVQAGNMPEARETHRARFAESALPPALFKLAGTCSKGQVNAGKRQGVGERRLPKPSVSISR